MAKATRKRPPLPAASILVAALMKETVSPGAPCIEALIGRCDVTDPFPISVEPTAR
jgi:hypothetical protein